MASQTVEEIEVEEGKKGGGGGGEGGRPPPPMFRDVRRYYCQFCGICRSKKSLIASHVLSHHQDEVGDAKDEGEVGPEKKPPRYTCEECGASCRKPAYLRQHMQGHSIERPFVCSVDDCHYSYRRKDHLARHLLQHQGSLFMCPVEDCNRRFSFQTNMQRHVKELHDEESPHEVRGQKKYICPETGCGKEFKYPSKLRKHEDSHVKLDYVEVICGEPSCMKHFTNEECLKAHIRSCHQHIQCRTCGTRQLKKNFKRHLRIHEEERSPEKIKCSFPGCLHTFSNGDFLEADEQFRSRPRGGRKRKRIMVESLLRKRIAASPDEINTLQNGTHYLSQILGDGQQ